MATEETRVSSELFKSSPSKTRVRAINVYNETLVYADERNLYYGDELIQLLEADNGSLNIHEIVTDRDSFYLATELGLFKNYRRIFSKEAVRHIELAKNKIFIATKSGLYVSEHSKGMFLDYNWQLVPNSPNDVSFFTLNKSKSNPEYLSSSSDGFFYYNSRKKQWLRRSSGLSRDFQDLYGMGRFLVIKEDKEKERIILPSSSGIFISTTQGQLWKRINAGLKSNPDGFYSIREVVKAFGDLFIATGTGLYTSGIDIINWQKVPIDLSRKNENMSEDYQDIYLDSKGEYLLLGNSQGQIFKLTEKERSATDKESQVPDESEESMLKVQSKIESILDKEPDIKELHRVALKFSGIPTGAKFRSYKRQARLRHLIPNFEAFVNRDTEDVLSLETNGKDDFNSASGNLSTEFEETNFNGNDSETNAGIRFSWNLSNLIFDPEVNDINTSARITANVRENLLTELTQIYFARKELLQEILELKFKRQNYELSEGFSKKKIRLEAYTAQLDARTGGWFSEHVEVDYFQV